MREIRKLILTAAFICIIVLIPGIHMNAQSTTEVYTESVQLTEEDRYNPQYYQPLDYTDAVSPLSELDESKSSFATVVREALLNREASINVSQFNLTLDDIQTKYFNVLNNYMDLFFVDYSRFSYSPGNFGLVARIIPTYILDEESTVEMQKVIDEVSKDAVSLVKEDMADYEKALVIHDWLATYCEYDYDNYLLDEIPDSSHSMYGPFLYKTAVCDGYAKAYKYIMQDKLGIPCYLTTSDEMNHAWNIIQIDGSYYHVDVTWDDPTWDSIGRVTHNNFLLSDTGIEKTEHSGWETTLTANDRSFDDAGLWKSSNGNIINYSGKWYFVDNEEFTLVKTSDIKQGQKEILYTFDKWMTPENSYYRKAYSYPQLYHDSLIFNGPKAIYRMSLTTGNITTEYTPAGLDAVGTNIYGLKLEGLSLYYAVQTIPNLKESQKEYIRETTLQKDTLKGTITIEGEERYHSVLTATTTLDKGVSDNVTYSWYRDGLLIEGETEQTYTVTGEDIGTKISVKVVHPYYEGELTDTTEMIQRALIVSSQLPALPALQGICGKTLADIELPEGYTWDNPSIIMKEPGQHSYPAAYCPDEKLYEPFSLDIKLNVVCIHAWNDGVTTTEPSCTESGEITYTCEICLGTKTETIDPTGHLNTEIRGKTEPSCTENGYTGDEYCLVCGEKLSVGKTISPTEHIWNDGVISTKPSCTKPGKKTYTCTICQNKKTEPVNSTGHLNTEIRDAIKPSCTENGYTGDKYCFDCNEIVSVGETISPTGHTWDDGVISTEPSCTKSGKKTYTCTNCQNKKTETVNPTGHLNTEVRDAIEPSCTENGYTGNTFCADCDKVLSVGESIPPTGHTWNDGVITKAPSVDEEGILTYTCLRCDAYKTEPIEKLKPSQDQNPGQQPDQDNPNPPTGDENKQDISDDQTTAPAEGTVLKTKDMTWQVTEKGSTQGGSGTVAFTGSTAKTVTIPKTITINNITYKVTSIAPKALKGKKTVKKIIIGANVVKIGAEAFRGCKNLKTIIIKSNKLKSVGKKAIKNINKKATIKCPKKKLKQYKKLFSAKTGYKKTMKIRK